MMKKRLVCQFLAAAMLLGLLAGCGGNAASNPQSAAAQSEATSTVPEQESKSEAPAAPSAAPAAESSTEESLMESAEEPQNTVSYPIYEEPVSFTWLDIRNPDYEQGVVTEGLAENEVYKAASELLGIRVDWQLRMDAATTYALIIAGGDYPDCWGSKLSDYYSSYETAYGEEVIIDLTDLMDEYMPNYTAALAEDKNLEATSYTDSGRRLAIYPINTGYTQFGGQIRGDIVDKLKLELPETFDDMYDMLKAMKSEYPESQPLILSKDGSQNCSWLGGGLGVMTTVSWRPFVQMNLYQVDGEVKLGLLEPEYKEYLELISKWYSEGLIYQDFFTNEGMGPPQDAIAYDTSFVWYGSVNEIPTLTGILRDEGAYIEGMADVTRKPGETIHLGDSTAKSITANGGYCVSTDCEHPEYVLQYMDYFYSEEGGMAANFGVEGETYTIVNGRPAYTDMILNNDTYTYVSALFKYCIYEGPFELDVNRYFAAFDENQKDAVERWESNRDEEWNLPAGLTLTTEETEERSNLIAEIGTYCSEMVLKFIVGELSIEDNWDAFTERVESMGAQTIIDITQAALDRYNA